MSSPRTNLVRALVIALAVHALLATALALCLSHAPAPDELAELDLTSVELSFAETVEETAAAVASAPSTPSEPAEAELLPPPTPPVVAASPPRQLKPKLPSPAELTDLRTLTVGRRETRDEKQQESEDSSEAAPRQARVDAPPKPWRTIRPDYPRESCLRGEQGDVALELDIAADGSVTAVRILKSSGYLLLDTAAVKTARAARFTPAMSGGKPVASTVRLPLSFRLK